ncbi:MAG: hypothetical protein H0W43_07105 [Chthoniobacterales bacterium]|nr:hypothetical protein [Chthoniobacterales bacterium]
MQICSTKKSGPTIFSSNKSRRSGSGVGKDERSAIIATLPVGAHSAILKGHNDGTGVGLVEVYDLEGDAPGVQLANISTRGKVDTGDNVMIGGFIVRGTEPTPVLVRALEPSLSASGVNSVLANPVLELHDLNGNVTVNDDWRSTSRARSRPPMIWSRLFPSPS